MIKSKAYRAALAQLAEAQQDPANGSKAVGTLRTPHRRGKNFDVKHAFL
jgi:hypothetical protein